MPTIKTIDEIIEDLVKNGSSIFLSAGGDNNNKTIDTKWQMEDGWVMCCGQFFSHPTSVYDSKGIDILRQALVHCMKNVLCTNCPFSA